jgi:hypothetical protein
MYTCEVSLLSGTTNIYLKGLYATDTTIMCDVPAVADGTVLANRPDKVLHGKKKNTCLLIDIALPDDPNVNTKETEKLSQYKELDMAVSRMWKGRTKIVPVTIGALGTIRKGLDQNLQLLPGHRSATELQNVTLMSTAQKC